jgi:hypothetical protein
MAPTATQHVHSGVHAAISCASGSALFAGATELDNASARLRRFGLLKPAQRIVHRCFVKPRDCLIAYVAIDLRLAQPRMIARNGLLIAPLPLIDDRQIGKRGADRMTVGSFDRLNKR